MYTSCKVICHSETYKKIKKVFVKVLLLMQSCGEKNKWINKKKTGKIFSKVNLYLKSLISLSVYKKWIY